MPMHEHPTHDQAIREGRKLIPQELMGSRRGLGAGHAACAGCPAPTVVQAALHAAREGLGCEPIITFATGCMEIVTSLYPYNAWRIGHLHSGLANSASIASGIEAAIRIRRDRGEIPPDRDIKVIAFGGDGGTYDSGLQALSGAMERGHDLTYVCHNNEACIHTGVQRPSATPLGALANAAPATVAETGAGGFIKDLTRMMIAQDLSYVAQASIARYQDMATKLQKAIAVRGPAFVNVLTSCPVGWGLASTDDVFSSAEIATECNVWPLYEYEKGKYRITYRPSQPRSVSHFLQSQARFRHLAAPGHEDFMERLQDHVDKQWQKLNQLEKAGAIV